MNAAEGGDSVRQVQKDIANVTGPTNASEAAAGEFIRAGNLVRQNDANRSN